jgi:hypothetical protein
LSTVESKYFTKDGKDPDGASIMSCFIQSIIFNNVIIHMSYIEMNRDNAGCLRDHKNHIKMSYEQRYLIRRIIQLCTKNFGGLLREDRGRGWSLWEGLFLFRLKSSFWRWLRISECVSKMLSTPYYENTRRGLIPGPEVYAMICSMMGYDIENHII